MVNEDILKFQKVDFFTEREELKFHKLLLLDLMNEFSVIPLVNHYISTEGLDNVHYLSQIDTDVYNLNLISINNYNTFSHIFTLFIS